MRHFSVNRLRINLCVKEVVLNWDLKKSEMRRAARSMFQAWQNKQKGPDMFKPGLFGSENKTHSTGKVMRDKRWRQMQWPDNTGLQKTIKISSQARISLSRTRGVMGSDMTLGFSYPANGISPETWGFPSNMSYRLGSLPNADYLELTGLEAAYPASRGCWSLALMYCKRAFSPLCSHTAEIL